MERKAAELANADKRQPAEPYVVPRKHIQLVIKRPTSPAKPEAAEAGSKFEEAWKAFDALGRKHQLRFIHDACLHVGFDPLKMAPRAEFGLADEEPELAEDRPADVVPAIDGDPVVQPEEWDDAADMGVENLQDRDDDLSEAADAEARGAVDAPAGVAPATHDAAAAQAEQRDDAAGLGAEDVQDADDDASEGAEQEDRGAEDLQGADHDVSKAAEQQPGDATKCAYCGVEFSSIDPPEMKYGRLYHLDTCVKYAKPLAHAA